MTDDGFLSLLDKSSEGALPREDLQLSASADMSSAEVMRRLDDGEELYAVVRCGQPPAGKDVVVRAKVDKSPCTPPGRRRAQEKDAIWRRALPLVTK